MKIAFSLSSLHPLKPPIACTIGMFDGVHLGHQHLLLALRKKVPTGSTVLITFSSHPQAILAPPLPPLLTSLRHKLLLLSSLTIDLVIILPFTRFLAQQPYAEFLSQLQSSLTFSHLLLGERSTLGNNREGTSEKIHSWAHQHHCSFEAVPTLHSSHGPLSSTHVRSLIHKGDLYQAHTLLGRPFSLYLSNPSPCIPLLPFCLPPEGHYRVNLSHSRFSQSLSVRIAGNHLHFPSPFPSKSPPLLLSFVSNNR